MEFGHRIPEPAPAQCPEKAPMKHAVKLDSAAFPQKMVKNKFAKGQELQRLVSDGDPPNAMDIEFVKTPQTGSSTSASTAPMQSPMPQPEPQGQRTDNAEVRRSLHFADDLITQEEMRRLQGGRNNATGLPERPAAEE